MHKRLGRGTIFFSPSLPPQNDLHQCAWDEVEKQYVTRYMKTDHLQENMILQDGVRMLP